jgi:hypothetical protein
LQKLSGRTAHQFGRKFLEDWTEITSIDSEDPLSSGKAYGKWPVSAAARAATASIEGGRTASMQTGWRMGQCRHVGYAACAIPGMSATTNLDPD